MTKLGLAFLALVIMTPTMVAYAEGVPPDVEGAIDEEPRAEKTRWVTLGIGLAAVPDYEGSEDYKGVPVPIVRVDWRSRRYVEISGTRLRANLVSGSRRWKAGPILGYSPGRDDVDNNRVDALRDIDDTVAGGGFVNYDAGKWETYIEFLTDVGDEHDGSLGKFRQCYKQPLGKGRALAFNFSLTYADDDYMEAFFGIDADNAARTGLSTFEAEGGFKDVEVRVAFRHRLSDRWKLAYSLGYKRLLGDAEDSPIVDDEGAVDQFVGAIIASATF